MISTLLGNLMKINRHLRFVCAGLLLLICTASSAQNAFSPKLTEFLIQHPVVSKALSNAVAEISSNRVPQIYYFYTTDETVSKSHHRYLGDSNVVGIFVRENQTPCDECISILFEAINVKGEKQFKALFDGASTGSISKDEFVRKLIRKEFDAVKETKKIIKAFDLAKTEIAQSQCYNYFSQCPDDFDGFSSYSKKISQNHYQLEYERLYERIQQAAASNEKIHR